MTWTTCSGFCAGSRPMPDARDHRHGGRRVLSTVLAAVLLGLAVPAVAFAGDATHLATPRVHDAAVPGDERCAEESPDPDTGQKPCDKPILSVANVLPVLGVAAAAGVLALILAFLVIRRRASAPFVPADPGEWWVCPKCGSTNVIGSARCYACGTWQR